MWNVTENVKIFLSIGIVIILQKTKNKRNDYMRNPNGFGSISKMTGNRRRPWRVRITVGWEINEATGREKQLSKTMGYFATKKEAMLALAEYNQNPYDLTNRDITFKKAYEAWSPKHYEQYKQAASNLKAAYKHCAPLENMRMIDIRLKHLQDIMDSIKEKSVSAQTNLKTVFSKTFTYAMENDIITKDYSQIRKDKPNTNQARYQK